MTTKALILIPARYQSQRFPGKPLAMLGGKSVIQRVYENMALTGHDTAVVTDDERIERHLQREGGRVVRVDDDVSNGTERACLAAQRYFDLDLYNFIVNVQGDEPLLPGEWVGELVNFHHRSPRFDVATLVCERAYGEDFHSPHVVKALVEEDGRCRNFFRNPSGEGGPVWYQHIGVYCYRPDALQKFCTRPPCRVEKEQALEQLGGLEAGLAYGAMKRGPSASLCGIDTPEDILRAATLLGLERNDGKP